MWSARTLPAVRAEALCTRRLRWCTTTWPLYRRVRHDFVVVERKSGDDFDYWVDGGVGSSRCRRQDLQLCRAPFGGLRAPRPYCDSNRCVLYHYRSRSLMDCELSDLVHAWATRRTVHAGVSLSTRPLRNTIVVYDGNVFVFDGRKYVCVFRAPGVVCVLRHKCFSEGRIISVGTGCSVRHRGSRGLRWAIG